jgi:hypothetical protein
MPYFVYRLLPENRPEYIGDYEKFLDAKAVVRALRAQEAANSGVVVRMMHAASQGEAERILLTPRDDRIIGDD